MKNRNSKIASVALPTQPRRQSRRRILGTSAAALLAISMMGGSAFGAADNYTGTTSAAWDTATNWSGGVPISTSQANFPAAIPGTGATITLTAGDVADSLNFANTYNLTGGSLALTTGNIQVVPAAAIATITSNLVNPGAAAGNITLTAGTTGTLVLAGTNTYTGTTTVASGTLNVTGSIAAGAGAVVNNDGNAFATLGGTGTINESVTLGGTTNANSNINLTGAGNITGTLTVNNFGGNWTGNGTVAGNVNVTTAAQLTIGAGAQLNSPGTVNLTGTATLAGPGAINANVNDAGLGDFTYNGTITGAHTLVVNNASVGSFAQMDLSGANNYTGTTTITGALGLTAGGTLGSGPVTVNANSSLFLNASTTAVAANITINGTGTTNFGGVGPLGAGAIFAEAGAANAINGTVTLGSSSTIGIFVGSVLTLNGAIGTNVAGSTLTLAADFNSSGGVINVAGSIGGTGSSTSMNVVVDSATINETAAAGNVYNGTTTIRSTITAGTGILNANAANALPIANGRSAVIMDDTGLGGSQLNLGANQAIASLSTPAGTTTSTVNLNGNQLTIGNGTTPGNAAAATTFNGVVSGAGGTLVKDGTSTQIFTNTNTYTGATTINNGILNFTTSTGNTSSITVNGSTAGPSGTLQLGQAGGGAVTVNQALILNGPGFNPGTGALGAINILGGAATTVTFNGLITAATNTPITPAGSTLNIDGGIFKAPGVTLTLGTTTVGQGGGIINIGGPGIGASGIGISGSATGALVTAPFTADLIVDSTTVNENIANNYVGNTFIRSTVAAGTLNLNVANALPNSNNANRNLRTVVVMGDVVGVAATTLNVASNGNAAQALVSPNTADGKLATVALNGNTFTIGNDVAGSVLVATGSTTGLQESFYGNITGTAASILIKDGISTQIIVGSGVIGADLGTVDVSQGILQIGDGVTAGAGNWIAAAHNVFVDPGATLNVNLVPGETFQPNVLDNSTYNSATNSNGVISIIAAGGTQTLGGQITGTGTVTANGGGTTVLSNVNGYQGGTIVINASTVQIGNAASGGTAGTGTITLGGSASASTGTLNVFNVSGGVLSNNITSGTFAGSTGLITSTSALTNTLSGAITNSGAGVLSITENGAGGTLILTNNADNIGTGIATVTAGTLQIGNGISGNLVTTSTIQVNGTVAAPGVLAIDLANGATFAPAVSLNGANASLNAIALGNTNTLSGVISGTGILNQNGTGTTILTNTETYTGATNVNTGTLQIGSLATAGNLAAGTAVAVANGGTLSLVNLAGGTFAPNVALNGPNATLISTPTPAATTFTLTGVISGSGGLTQNGAGTTVLDNTDTYTGPTNVSAGILQIGDAGTGGNLTGNGGVNVANNAALTVTHLTAPLTFTPNVNLNGPAAAMNLNGAAATTYTYTGSITGTGILNQTGAGTSVLTGANSYSGQTTITAGVLQVGAGGAAGTLGTGPVVDNATLTFDRSDTVTVANAISGNGVVNQGVVGGPTTGVTILTGNNTYTGLTNVVVGTLEVGSNTALGTTAAGTTVASGASLLLANGINVGAEALSINGVGVNAGLGTIGALATTGGISSYAGAITAATNATISADGGTLTLTGGIIKTGVNVTLGGGVGALAGGTININTVGISGAAANSDLIVDSTTVNENAADTYNGKTFVRSTLAVGSGVLNANVANALPTANGRSTVVMDDSGQGGSTLNIGSTANGGVGGVATTGANQSIASLDGAASSKVVLGANTLTIGFGNAPDTNGNAAANFAGVISGTGGITKDETSTQVLSGTNTYTGATLVSSGTLRAGSTQAFGANSATTVNTPGILDLAGNSNTLGSLSGTGTVTNSAVALAPATLTVGTLNTNTTFSGIIADANIPNALSLIKVGTGTLTLTGTNTYNGTTLVAAGILNIQNASALGTVNAGTTVANGATLQIQGGITTLAEALTLNGAGAAGQTGALVNSGGVNVFTGPITLGSASTISSDVGTLTVNNAAPIVGNGNALTLAGASNGFVASVINNTVASVTKNGGGTWQLGAGGVLNTYTGPTTINAGTLQAGSVQAFGNKSIVTLTAPLTKLDLNGFSNTIGALSGVPGSLVDNTGAVPATLTTGQAASSLFAGTIENTGSALSVIKVGASTFILAGRNTYTGNTFVNGGILQVDGSTTSPNTYVAFGAQLQGVGNIGGNLINSGTVKPGDSPGTLSVKNNYTQTTSGNLRIELASTASYGRLQVGGHASLNGALTAVSDGGFTPKAGNTFTILTAAGGVTGKFNTFNNQTGAQQSTLLKFEIEYDPNDVKLEFVQSGFLQSLKFEGLTPNQQAVASELDHVIFDKRMGDIIAFLDKLPLSAIPGALDQIAPEELASIYNTGVALANVQSINLQRRTADIRAGTSGFSASGFHMAGSGPDYSGSMSLGGAAGPSGPDGKEVKETKQVVPDEPKFGVFLTGIGEWVNVGSDFNSRGYDLDSGGFTLGLDYKLTPTLAIGLNAGYAHTNGDLNNGGRLDVDGGTVGLYATYFPSDFYIDTAVTGGYNSYSTKRAGLAGSTFGETDGGSLNVLFGTGYMVHTGGLTFGPTGTFQYTYMGVNEFTEHGSLAPLDIPGQSQESVRTAFGAKASYDWKAGGVVIRPEVSLAWQHEYADAAYEIDGRFANGAGGVFAVHGPSVGRDSLLLGAGVAVQWSERLSTYVYYDGEFGRTNYQDSNVSGGFRVSF